MTFAALIVAAGNGKRFGSKIPKQFHNVDGDTVINHSIKKFLKIKKISLIIISVDKKSYIKYRHLIVTNKKIIITNGGKTRALSVKNGLKIAKINKINKIFIHDAARPYFSLKIINEQFRYLNKFEAIVPVTSSDDTVIFKNNLLPRKKVFKIQTPQAFDFKSIYKLHLLNRDKNISDDSGLFFKKNIPVKIINGNFENKKITYLNDLHEKNFYGIGYDIHEMIKGRKLIVGGVEIPSPMGPMGHSDGDSLLHALIDSFLGAFKKGDIGTLFPNTNKYKDVKSTKLLKKIIIFL